jgi:hypothetical protein
LVREEAPLPVLPVIEEIVVEPVVEEPVEPKYPVVYYNPKVPDEKFLVGGSPYKHYFNNGRYLAHNEAQELAVRGALRAWGPDKPDRWKGDDRPVRTFKNTGFTSGNQNVIDDYEAFHID